MERDLTFSSFEFILYFLPAFLAVNFVVPKKWKNTWLMLASFGFYAYGTWQNPLSILLLFLSVFINYNASIVLGRKNGARKTVLFFTVAYNLLLLFLFKYAVFFLENIAALIGLFAAAPEIPRLNLALPLGLSFYTFSAISYLVDVYRRTCRPARTISEFGAYLCMFPKLISGPIARYSDLREEFRSREYSLLTINDGLQTFVFGLGIKVILADQIGLIWNEASKIGFDSLSVPMAWMGIFSYSTQLYLDFWGYSLMAMGLGEAMGFTIPKNFNSPYMALSMTDFWRRWHITLGSWFRDYVYIPLGGSRNGTFRMLLSTASVWLLTGLWHGASWNFVLWGGILCILILTEKLVFRGALDRHPLVGHLYMLFIIPLSWLVFAVENVKDIGIYCMRLIGMNAGGHVFAQDYQQFSKGLLGLFALGLFFCTGIPEWIYEKHRKNILVSAALVAVFWLCMWCIKRGLSDPFMYFQF